MADNIRVDTADLEQCASQYLSALEILKEAHSAYQKSIDALRGDWTGTAFEIMSGKVASMGANIVKSFDKLTNAVSGLKATKEKVIETENDIKGVVPKNEGEKAPFANG